MVRELSRCEVLTEALSVDLVNNKDLCSLLRLTVAASGVDSVTRSAGILQKAEEQPAWRLLRRDERF